MPHEYKMTISGHVQGVFFRIKTKSHAERLGINGTVRNLPNGDVEICVFGTHQQAKELIAAMRSEPPPIQIVSVIIKESTSEEIRTSFKVID